MPDLNLNVTVSRAALSLGPLHINDGIRYKIGGTFLGGTESWNRVQLTSPYIDGAATVSRTRQMVNEPVEVRVYGRGYTDPTRPWLTADRLPPTPQQRSVNEQLLIAAFQQDNFTLKVTVNGVLWAYACEAADLTRTWSGALHAAGQALLTFTMPRQPNLIYEGPVLPGLPKPAQPDDPISVDEKTLDDIISRLSQQLGAT